MDDENVSIAISMPLDSEGFLRRSCSNCYRELKWPIVDDPKDSVDLEEYFCPYCALTSASDAWWTEAQLQYATDEALEQVVGPGLDELEQSLKGLGTASGGLISASIDRPQRQHAPPIIEPDDMRRITFSCHPKVPVKIDENWTEEVHCVVCGTVTGPS